MSWIYGSALSIDVQAGLIKQPSPQSFFCQNNEKEQWADPDPIQIKGKKTRDRHTALQGSPTTQGSCKVACLCTRLYYKSQRDGTHLSILTEVPADCVVEQSVDEMVHLSE